MLPYSGAKVQSRFYPGDLVTRTRSVSGRFGIVGMFVIVENNNYSDIIFLFMTLIIIYETEIREINTSLAIQCMQARTRGSYKTINTDFKRINTPFVLNISQRSSEGTTDPLTHRGVQILFRKS